MSIQPIKQEVLCFGEYELTHRRPSSFTDEEIRVEFCFKIDPDFKAVVSDGRRFFVSYSCEKTQKEVYNAYRSKGWELGPPSQPAAVRAILRNIADLIEKLKSINQELEALPVMEQTGNFYPKPAFMDREAMKMHIEKLKKIRAHGVSLDYHQFVYLNYQPIAVAEFIERARNLRDAKADVLIALREYQLNGLDFVF